MKAILTGVGIGIVVAVFTWWLNQDRYDVRYTLSEQIALEFDAAQPQEAVQQLEIKNVGRKPAVGIQVNIPAKVLAFHISKNSEADQPKTFDNPAKFEVDYGSLPPQGSFRLVFKTKGLGVAVGDVEVRHDKGLADEALSAKAPFASAVKWADITSAAVYVVLALFWLRGIGADSWETHATYDIEKVLRASKPFYISSQRWEKIRDRAAERLGHSDEDYGELTQSEIAAWGLYRWLSADKPSSMMEDEWSEIRAKKTKQFIALVTRRISEWRVTPRELLALLKLSKPKHIPSEEWERLQKELRRRYVNVAEDDLMRDIKANRRISKPADVEDDLWSEVESKVRAARFSDVSRELTTRGSPDDFLRGEDLSILQPQQVAQLKERAYSEQLHSLELRVLQEPGASKFLAAPRQSWILDHDYARLRGMAEKIVFIDTLARTKSEEATEFSAMKTKILKQLAILERVFVDPKSIERVEPYDNPFASGNWELLRRVAAVLLQEKGLSHTGS